MTRSARLLLLCGLAGGVLAAPETALAQGVTIYEGARLIDGNGGRALESSAFVVADGKFTRVGRKEAVPAPKDRKSTRLNSSHVSESRMPSSA